MSQKRNDNIPVNTFKSTWLTPAFSLAVTTCSMEKPNGNPLSTALNWACFARWYLSMILGASVNMKDKLLQNLKVMVAVVWK